MLWLADRGVNEVGDWSRDCFKILSFVVMQRVARVCQRQLSYLSRYATGETYMQTYRESEPVKDNVVAKIWAKNNESGKS